MTRRCRTHYHYSLRMGRYKLDAASSPTPTGQVGIFLHDHEPNLQPDHAARIHDAIGTLNESLASSGVSLSLLDGSSGDAAHADIHLQHGPSSLCGGVSDGVLGCATDAGQVTIIDSWNWYTGVDPESIGPDLDPAHFFDPDLLDPHTAAITWGDGTATEPGSVDEAAGTVAGSHVYADNGLKVHSTAAMCMPTTAATR